MAKIFQVVNGFCFCDYTMKYKSVEEAKKHYAPDIEFVEAPDFVFENWGYNPKAKGDARFIKPVPPEGWLYDENTGTFYMELTPSQKREKAYQEEPIIEYQESLLTVDAAEQLASKYMFEETEAAQEIVNELKTLITQAKQEIREKYPDE